MKTYIALIICICLSTLASFTQDGSAIELAKLQTNIANEAKDIHSLAGTFLQVKTVASLGISIESKGKFFFKKNGNKFRWEYLSPTQFVIIYANDEFKIKQFENVDQKQATSTVFTELNTVLLQALNGKLKPNESFDMSAMEYDAAYTLILTPVESELSILLKSVILSFDKSTYSVNSITLTERNEDNTLIQLTNLKKNKAISDNLFE